MKIRFAGMEYDSVIEFCEDVAHQYLIDNHSAMSLKDKRIVSEMMTDLEGLDDVLVEHEISFDDLLQAVCDVKFRLTRLSV